MDAANTVSECRKDDNQVNADVTIVVEYPDLKIGQEDITLPIGPYYEGTAVPITVNVKNIGGLAASSVAVRMYNGNPSAGGAQLGPDQVIPTVNAGGAASLAFTYDTLGKQGTNIIYFVVDPANAVAESSETNNAASVALAIQPPVLPDLVVTADDVLLSPVPATEGDRLLVSTTIHNLGAQTGNIPVRFYLGNPASGGVLLSEQTIYTVLAPGGATMLQANIDTAGYTGQREIFIVVDPANAIAESREDNNTASKSLFIQSAGLLTIAALDKTAYQANEIVTATITATNSSGISRTLTLNLFIKDMSGNLITTISSADPISVNPNSGATITRTWNTDKTLAGTYSFFTEITEGGRIISRANAGFSITPDKRIEAKATTDKITYNPNEAVALTSVITSQSANYIQENLTVFVKVGQSAVIYTETKTIGLLMPGATFTFKSYWNTGTYAPGTYPVTLEVKDASGAVIATGMQTITISSIVKPSAVLKGRLSVDRQSLLSGETVSASYSVTNSGNIDLQNVTFSILTVHVVNETVYNTLTYQAAIPMGGTYSNIGQIDTTNYTAKDYLVILRANISGVEETLAGTYFRVEGAPTSPSLASPEAGSDVLTFTPTLSVNNAADPNDDKLAYEFELYMDNGLSNLLVSSGTVTEGAGMTSWEVPQALTENNTYFWRAPPMTTGSTDPGRRLPPSGLIRLMIRQARP